MSREDGHRVAKDQVFVSVQNRLLAFGKVWGAKEARTATYALFVYVREGADDPARIVLDADGETSAANLPLPALS